MKENGLHDYVGICRAYLVKGVGPDIKPIVGNLVGPMIEQYDIEPTSFVNVGPTKLPTNTNVCPTNDCYLGVSLGTCRLF